MPTEEKPSMIEQIDTAFKEKRYIEVVALINIWVESLLRLTIKVKKNIIFFENKISLKHDKGITEWIERGPLSSLIHTSFLMGTITPELYEKLKEFNKKRNNFFHDARYLTLLTEKQAEQHYKLGKTILKSFKFILYNSGTSMNPIKQNLK